MANVKNWLEAELQRTVDALNSIPIADRKGLVTGVYRQRARDVTVALRLVEEFESSWNATMEPEGS